MGYSKKKPKKEPVMNRFKKYLAATLMAVLGVGTIPSAQAQGVNVAGIQVVPFYTQYQGQVVTAVNTDTALFIKYIGATVQAATVAVAAADSDVTLTVAAANDATVNIQAGGLGPCGASVGVLDTADTDCDTLGELVDHINASTNWAAVIVTGLRADATANTLFTVASTDARTPSGVSVFWETPQALAVNVALLPYGPADGSSFGIQTWLSRDRNNLAAGKLATRPFPDRDTTFLYYSEVVTSTGAVGNIIVYCSYDNYSNAGQQKAGTQNDIILYSEAGAATTVTGKVDELLNAGGVSCSGGRVWARISATTDLTVPRIVISGFQRLKRVV